MKLLNKKIVFLVLFSVFLGFILGQNYDIAKNYFNFEFLKATVNPNPPLSLSYEESDEEPDSLTESFEELVLENDEANEIGQIGQAQKQEMGQLTLAEIQEVLDDINEQIDTINQEINKLRGEILEFSESEEESIIEEEILFEEELEDEEEEKDEEKEEKKEKEDICPAVSGININTASKEELEKITGVGPIIAQKIIEARPFSSIYDLTRVAGIGEKTLEKIIEQGCAYVEGDTGRPSSAEPISFSGGGGGGGGGASLTPTPIINLSFLPENPVDKDIEVNLSTTNLKPATYDVKISLLEISEQSEQKRTISEIYDGEKWQSSYNYLLKVFSETSFEGNFQLRIKQDKQDFRGEADIVVKIRDNEKEKIQAQWQGKINIIEPEEDGEEPGEEEEEPEGEERQEEENGEKIFFEISPLSLIFRAPYGEIPEPQLLYVSGLVDGVYVSGLIDGLVFPSWIIVEAEQDNFKVSVDVSGKNPGTYEDIIEINYRSQSEKIPVSLEIFEEVKNLLKNEFFKEWELEENKPDYWKPTHWTASHSFKNNWFQDTDALVRDYSVRVGSSAERILIQDGLTVEAGTYYASLYLKGGGEARVAILMGATGHTEYGSWTSIDEIEWTKVTHIRSISAGDQGGIRIQTEGSVWMLIGAAWLGTTEPPANWP